ncbi:MAG: ABC transporter substrate-binding protein [Eubacteriales bacterium]|nr:ABC transporter substrate-binding protein [Eubacteriales bacterium]MDD3199656.1 ABC transporter substrate-binding protein [Eubacteriales bacterium]MDD4121361.1 ABC transporter substrate-binding protein [Eubacteriales bacterium]MDD4629797.1 ABC transporter substrate-binding protein [Eubacteriales bacterium]
MHKVQKHITAIVILICTTLLSGCATFDNFKSTFLSADAKEKDTIKIGVFEPLSGSEKEHGELELQGIELAHEMFPKVLGKDVELVYADNKSDVDVAASVAKDLVEKKVSVVLGSHSSILSLVGGEYFTEAKIPAITITSANPLVTSSSEYYFRTCFVDSFQGTALAKYIVEQQGASKAAIFKDRDDDYAAAVSQTFTDKFIQLTGDEKAIAKVVEYTKNEKDFENKLKMIRDSGVNTVLLASKNADAIRIMEQAKDLKMQFMFLGTDKWGTEGFLEEGGTAVEGAVFSAVYNPQAVITEITDVFLKAYGEKYGNNAAPPSEVALGFDTYLLAINAIEKSGTAINGEAIKDKLAATKNFSGASGKITFDQNGDPIKSVVIQTITNGEFVHIYTVEPTWK